MILPITVAVEGDTDVAVAARLLHEAGGRLDRVYTVSKPAILTRLAGYNEAALTSPWYVQVDLDHEECVGAARSAWLPSVNDHLCFAIAVREVEAWLLADAEAISGFLRCPAGAIPSHPDELPDAKEALLSAAHRSSSPKIRRQFLPRPSSGRRVGPEYATELIRFAQTKWRPSIARRRSPSLDRALERLTTLVQNWSDT